MNKLFDKKVLKRFGSVEKLLYLCNCFSNGKTRAFSSAGLEHLPYKQRVGGSNPSTPTKLFRNSRQRFVEFFFLEVLS